jgi:hypothetical protein
VPLDTEGGRTLKTPPKEPFDRCLNKGADKGPAETRYFKPLNSVVRGRD